MEKGTTDSPPFSPMSPSYSPCSTLAGAEHGEDTPLQDGEYLCYDAVPDNAFEWKFGKDEGGGAAPTPSIERGGINVHEASEGKEGIRDETAEVEGTVDEEVAEKADKKVADNLVEKAAEKMYEKRTSTKAVTKPKCVAQTAKDTKEGTKTPAPAPASTSNAQEEKDEGSKPQTAGQKVATEDVEDDDGLEEGEIAED